MATENYIIGLYKYFSRYVGKEVLKKTFKQIDKKYGYDEYVSEVMSLPDDYVIDDIDMFVISPNRKMVSDAIKSTMEVSFFVEYGQLTFDPLNTNGVKERLAITICKHFDPSNTDNLNEALIMNLCLDILKKILVQMDFDQSELETCGVNNLIKFPAEIYPVNGENWYDRIGWTALFQNENSYV